ncbi:putative TetR family transcriptional regulator [Gordonia effusa NBRC 100432]|uniref:Putative TetR family transcriptional regulator n=1 Tax=Gordonia effusa NBRC 100432 TaxID=1077974 RepID=H0R2K6_9ACTN|nr:TetR/AcrR family transcriptional regulator [Gordonia effusa]GAB19307.1 putative TetR family transcriptional regulator [Gordonia effusa NBRC 100432]
MPPTRSLQRDDIVDTAIAILQRDGVDGLSMRRLAVELDSKPMTLYHYVPNKSALLSLALSEVAGRIPWATPTGPPRERMVIIATDMFDKLREIPWIVGILRQGTNVGTPALALANEFFTAAAELDINEQDTLDLWRAVWYLVVSELQWLDTLANRAPDDKSWHEKMDPAQVAHLPKVAAIIPRWRELSDGFDIQRAIEAQIDGVIARAKNDHR